MGWIWEKGKGRKRGRFCVCLIITIFFSNPGESRLTNVCVMTKSRKGWIEFPASAIVYLTLNSVLLFGGSMGPMGYTVGDAQHHTIPYYSTNHYDPYDDLFVEKVQPPVPTRRKGKERR